VRERKNERERHTHRQTRIKVKDGKKVGINMTLVTMKKKRRNLSRECTQPVVYYDRST